jgi:hypothetical protein
MPIAETIPLATASQEVIPPKTLTNTLRTTGRTARSPGRSPSPRPRRRRRCRGSWPADPAELLARVGDHVQGGHDQARAVADDADLAVELDVVEVLGLGPGLERVVLLGGRRTWRPAGGRRRCRPGVTLPSTASTSPSSVSAIGLTSTSVASSSANMAHSRSASSAACGRGLGRDPAGRDDLGRLGGSTPVSGRPGSGPPPPGWCARPPRSPCRPAPSRSTGTSGWPGRAGRRGSTRRDVEASAIRTLWTVWPLMSMPRICLAFS